MGFSSYVFPSGEHSRFVHSLGVLCIMGKMCEHLYRKYGEASSSGICFTIEDARKLRIAALLHDVGHFPFSHLTECVYSYIDNNQSTDDLVDGVGDSLKKDDCLLSTLANFRKLKLKDHEHLGAEVIKRDPEIFKILSENSIQVDEIGKIIIGDIQARPIYAQLLHSSLDADRLDYLLRDSRQAGVAFGNVELEYILRQLRIERVQLHKGKDSEDTIELIVFDVRCQHAIEHFLMARFFHYTQVVFHKTSMAIEAVAKALEYKFLMSEEAETKYKSYESICDTIGTDDFYYFTDDYMWERIKKFCCNSSEEYIQVLWKCLCQRSKPKHVLTMTDIIPKMPAHLSANPVNDSVYFLAKWLIQNNHDELAKKVKIGSAYLGYVESKINLESIPSHLRAEDCSVDNFPDEVRGAIRIIDKDDRISFLASDNKSLINKMVDYTSNTLDIFVIGEIEHDKIEKLEKLILSQARKS